MNPDRVSVDDPVALHRILANAEALFLDFDGPVCSVFSSFPAHLVAHQLRGVLADGGHEELSAEIEKTDDPFDVLFYAAKLGHDEARYVEAAMRVHEIEAIASAYPTPGGHTLIRDWHATGRKLAIVSNNSAVAVEAYLHVHGLDVDVDCVSARTAADPSLLKPNPFLLNRAIQELGVRASLAVLVGDSPTDVQAGKAAGTPVIGYANKTHKISSLAREDPAAFTTSIQHLVVKPT